MDQKLFEVATAAIIDTAREAFIEGYKKACAESWAEATEKEIYKEWLESETYAALVKLIKNLSGGGGV